jgi:hypothetical protein
VVDLNIRRLFAYQSLKEETLVFRHRKRYISMKPYKILKPKKILWRTETIKVSIIEKKAIKLKLKLFTKCNPMPKNIADQIRIKYED